MKKYVSLSGNINKSWFNYSFKIVKNKYKQMSFLGESLVSYTHTAISCRHQIYITDNMFILTNNTKKYRKKLRPK